MASMSKEEYLKRYLSGPSEETKKKKKKAKVKSKTSIRIVDDDVDWRAIAPDVNDEPEALDIEEEKPSVAGVIDERPDEEVQLEAFRQSDKWRLMGKDIDKNKSGKGGFHSVNSPSQSPRRRHDSDSDQSPPRRQRNGSDSDQSPPRKGRQQSDSDQSPPRRKRHDSDQSPPRRKRHDSDQSPPRKRKPNSDSDQSPPRRKRHDSDQSPPRKRGRDHGTNQSPKRRRHDSDDDLSPPRRRADADEDLSPPRRRQRHDSDSDLSPPRPSRADSDQSPPRQKPSDGRRKDKQQRKSDQLEMGTGLSGKRAGLQDAQSLREEAKMIKAKEKAMFDRMNEEVSGKNAETVYREKGRKRDLKAEKIKQREEENKAREEQEKYMEWGRGVAQTKQQEANIADHLKEMDKPLARYRDDNDLDQMLKEQDREGDPMLAFLSKKKSKGKDGKERPRYSGPAPPPNRFNLWPGYRWDGVDRSNGFEKRFFQAQANKRAVKDEAYKWSVEDM
ncbi:BUD13 homolog [Branchiostoma floridae]|uniref:BUD13 homolog n=1 Tax=Branchiostoma floridae TaxID=7739 RepID=A0A9J7MH42_BRAFL|nr:BUD13 homolog [Branchiostoma floridae]